MGLPDVLSGRSSSTERAYAAVLLDERHLLGAQLYAEIAARDAKLPEWTRAYARLKRYAAAAAWADEPESSRALFSPPKAVQAPKRRGRAKLAVGQLSSPGSSNTPA